MNDYGEFVAREPYVSGAVASVDIAAPKSGKTERVALKRFHPPVSRQASRVLQLESWRLGMERQRRIALDGGAAVQVLAFGTTPEGEYAILPWNGRSLLSVVTSVAPTGDRLRAVTAGLLQALASWEKHSGRPHGNLKPSNIFLVGEGTLSTLQFQLSDPAWSLAVPTNRLRRQELAQLGAIIIQWVRRREAGGVPIEHAPEWDRLGRGGSAWREFCNFLLDLTSDPAGVTLESAEARLRAIPTDFRPERLAIKVGAGVALAVGCLLIGYARLGDPRSMPEGLLWLAEKTGNAHAVREQTIPEWGLLCEAWDDWAANLMAQSAALEQNKELWADNDALKAALVEFSRTAEAFRPNALVPEDTGGRSYISLARNPPVTVRRERVVRRIEASWKAVSTLQHELEQWWRWPTLRSLRDSLAVVGKKEAVSGVQTLAPPPSSPAPHMESRPFVLALTLLANDPSARLLSAEWTDWSTSAGELQKSRDRVQVAMPALALRSVSDSQDLTAFAGSLGAALHEMQRRRALFLSSAVAQDRFLKESPLLSEKGEVVPADLKRWDDEVISFSHLPPSEDPRSAIAWDTRLTAMQSSAADLEDEIPAADATAPTGVALLSRAIYTQESERVRTEVTRLRSRDVIRRELPDLTQQTNRAQENVVTLEERLEATLALLRPDRWLAGIAARQWPTDAARQRWEAWRRERLANAPAPALEKDRARFRVLRKEERTLRDWLEALNSANGLGAEFSLKQTAISTQRALATVMATLREKAATAAVSAAEWSGPLPSYPFADTLSRQSAVRSVVDEYQKWVRELPTFATDLEGLGSMLTQGMSWSEGLAESYARAAGHRGAELLEGDLKRWLQSAQHLRELAGTNDTSLLATSITGGDLATGLTAWKRLGELPNWPSDNAQLAREVEFGTVLHAGFEKLPAGTRRETLNTALVAGQRERWLRVARIAVREPKQVDGAFSQARALSVDPDGLDPAMAYDLRLWELGRQSQMGDLSQLKSARDEFVAAIRKLSALSANQAVATFLKALEAAPLKDDDPQVKTRTPRLAGWREEPGEDGRRLATTWSVGGRKVALEYQLIEPTDGTEAFFLARRAIAVGEFIDLIAAHPQGSAIFEAMPAWVNKNGIAPGDVIASWEPSADHQSLRPNPTWFFNASALLKGKIDEHPPGLMPAIDEKPTLRSPLQYIPPEIARVFAEQVLGARLPTPTEWKALVRGEPPPTEGNFRSAVFKNVWQFAVGVHDNGVPLPWRPSAGAFSPALPANSVPDDGNVWPGAHTTGIWPTSVDEGPVHANIINLFGNVWIYLWDDARKEFSVAGGSILTPPTIDIREPQRLQSRMIIGRRGAAYGDGFTDVGIRPAFDAPASLRQRLQFSRMVRAQSFIMQ